MSVPVGVESWIWYSIAMLAVTVRFISRYIQLESIVRLQLEDYLMVLAACLYTILIVLLNIVSEVQTNLIAPEDLPNLDAENLAERIRGSKMVLALECCMCSVIWLCKSCILLLYHKLTFGLKQHVMVKVTGVYVVGSFVVMMILYLAVWCRPFSGYWETPTSNDQCNTATNHLITNFTFNVTSDLLIISIPLPLLLRSSLPLRKKLALTGLFSVALFIMVCAVFSKYYSFRQPFSPIWIYWYTREASTAVVVTNMTHIWTLARRIFNLRSFTGSSERNGEAEVTMSSNGRSSGRGSRRLMIRYPAEMGSAGDGRGTGTGIGISGSQQSKGEGDKRRSMPFADIGGLLPTARSPIRKSNGSISPLPPHVEGEKRRISLASVAGAPSLRPPPQHKRASWRRSSLISQADYGGLPSPGLSLETSQQFRNPAALAEQNHRPRGLQRVDSITLLGLPDG